MVEACGAPKADAYTNAVLPLIVGVMIITDMAGWGHHSLALRVCAVVLPVVAAVLAFRAGMKLPPDAPIEIVG